MKQTLQQSDEEQSPLEATPVQARPDLDRTRALSRERTLPPGHVPGYELLARIGQGSFGSVWLARELKTGKQVAIKFYTHRRGLDWSLLSREVERLAVLYTSRNIVGLLDVGWDHDPPYFVMEYLESGSLADRLEPGPIPIDEAVRFTRDIARALVHAHGSGILHCDLKPANVLLGGNDEARLGDFGQSRLTTEQNPALGTLYYMAPEQAVTDGVPDARWDVYALGALLFQMLTGSPPYRDAKSEAMITATDSLPERLKVYREVIAREPTPEAHRHIPGVDRALATIIDRCLESDVSQRLKNPQMVLDLLDQREQMRAKRPLIWLGLLGPVLFLVAAYWIATTVVPRVVETAEENLLDRALASDVVSARILAASVHQDLQVRENQLTNEASRQTVRDIIVWSHGKSSEELLEACSKIPANERPPAYHAMNDIVVGIQERLNVEGHTQDESWFVSDLSGRQVYRYPADQNTVGGYYFWRDYFHGRGADIDPKTPGESVTPRTEPGISPPFRSQATDQYMVAIAVPIVDHQSGEPIGVLARTIHLTNLLKQWEVRIRSTPETIEDENGVQPTTQASQERFLALADTRGGNVRLLDHPWMTTENLRKIDDELLESNESPLRMDVIESGVLTRSHRTSSYNDPIGQLDQDFAGEWLAASSPVGDTGWTAIVQERRDVALEPVGELRGVFVRAGFTTLGIFTAILGLLWYLIHRVSRR